MPQNKKAGETLKYYHDSTPLNAYHSIYSDIYIHKWLDAPHDGMEPIPAGTLKSGDNELVIRNDCAEISVLYVIIR